MWARCQRMGQICCDSCCRGLSHGCDEASTTTVTRSTGNKVSLRLQSSATARTASQTFQHANAAKCRLRRTAGRERFDDLAASAEKLLGCAVHTLNGPSEAAAANFAILASLLAY
jgi:hypothetical protein